MYNSVPLDTYNENLIKKAINGPPGNPDWASILSLIKSLDSHRELINNTLAVLYRHISHGQTGRKLNCLILIDALFKNSKPESLIAYQTQTFMDSLDSDMISNNAQLHNFLYENMSSWIKTLKEKNVLDPQFDTWVKNYCSTHFIPKLTKKIRKKLFRDLNGCIEILTMLTECLSNYSSTDHKILSEMVLNAEEITRRLVDLQPTIVDQQLSNAIYSTRELCDSCLHCYRALQNNQNPHIETLQHMMSRSAQIVEEMSHPLPKPQKQTRVPPKMQKAEQNDLTDAEFFIRLAQLKTQIQSLENDMQSLQNSPSNNQQQAQPQQPPPVTDSLIDF
ncbi:hypothetical protein M9Y10_041077 [Tritrichomonas musculus]|uniref:VHS domain-containing protein n=1 Tax=Tritrichomonas musculus TaxID=1915356 RepID=A0ABR2K3Z0_9EUKA